MDLLLEYDLPTLSLVLVLIAVIAFFIHALLNLIKHPLSNFPGPRLWACSRLPYAFFLQKGTLTGKVKILHDIYGPVVRVAPDELSFIAPEAWKDIYCGGSYGFARSPTFYGPMGKYSIATAGDDDHARIRRALGPAFRGSAMKVREEGIKWYVDMLVEKLSGGKAQKQKKVHDRGSDEKGQGEEVTVDILQWLNFTSFDIMGHMVYGGEPFGCLRQGQYHPCVALIIRWLKATGIIFSIRLYAPLDRVLLWLMPPSLVKLRDEFERLGWNRVRELKLIVDGHLDKFKETETTDKKGLGRATHSDLMSQLKSSESSAVMTLPEMVETFQFIVAASSETVATLLAGTINCLCHNPAVLKKLANEVRGAVSCPAELSLANLSQLPYLTAVLKEGLRVISLGPFAFPRDVPSEGATVAGHWVPGQTVVTYSTWAACQSSSNFYQPAEFLPERWLESANYPSSPFASDRRDAFQPFGMGPRNCLGQVMAWAEMRLILARLVWTFDIKAAREVGDWNRQQSQTVWAKEPFEVRLRRRSVHT